MFHRIPKERKSIEKLDVSPENEMEHLEFVLKKSHLFSDQILKTKCFSEHLEFFFLNIFHDEIKYEKIFFFPGYFSPSKHSPRELI